MADIIHQLTEAHISVSIQPILVILGVTLYIFKYVEFIYDTNNTLNYKYFQDLDDYIHSFSRFI